MTPSAARPAKIGPVRADSRAARSGVLHRTILSILAAAGLAVSGAACGTAAQPSTASAAASQTPASASRASASPAPAAARSASTATPVTGHASSSSGSLRLLTEPAAGIAPIYQLITGARSSVDLTMYELNDPTAEADLAADTARGVNVRVLLDQHEEKSRNTAAYTYLAAHRVHVRWAPSGTTYHQKTLTVDNATSVIMTLNLAAEDYPGTRDFAVIDTSHADVAAITATFNADFAGRAHHPARRHRPGLVAYERPGLDPVRHRRRHPHPRRRRRGNGRPNGHRRPGLRRSPRRKRHHHHDRRPGLGQRIRPASPGRRPRPPLPRRQHFAVHPRQGPSRRRLAAPASRPWSDPRISP